MLRGFAALSVVVYHVIELFGWTDFPSTGVLSWFRIGWMGVDLFFVISGFVIGLSAFAEIDKSGAGKFRQPFFARRVARVVPLHYLTMLVFVAFIVPELLFRHFWENIVTHLLFIHNLHPRSHGALNGSNWSLATEMQFYLLMLFVAPWLRVGKWWVIAAVCISISWAWRFGVALFIIPSPETEPFAFFAATQLPGMLDEFCAGLLLARLVRSEAGAKLLAGGAGVRLSLFVLAVLTTTLALGVYWRYTSYWDYPWMVTAYRSLMALAFASVVFFAVSLSLPGRARKLLSPLFYLGTISYGIYLWHLPVLLSLKRLEGISQGTILFVGLALTCLFASVSWHFFEEPLITRFRRKPIGIGS